MTSKLYEDLSSPEESQQPILGKTCKRSTYTIRSVWHQTNTEGEPFSFTSCLRYDRDKSVGTFGPIHFRLTGSLDRLRRLYPI